MAVEARALARANWLQAQLGDDFTVAPLAGDASFRCYFRVRRGDARYVLMDAPPQHEDVRPFLRVRAWLEDAGLRVSALYGSDIESGFLLLEDFGDITWAVHLAGGGDVEPLFTDALEQLHGLQASSPGFELPLFDLARMQRECRLYLEWYLPHVAGVTPDDAQCDLLMAALEPALKRIESLPRMPVHLDYHSRNLMLPGGSLPLGQIDYQDAGMGPVTYDLASLLYDCYQDYPESVRRHWSECFYRSLPAHLAAAFTDFDDWHMALRLTAMQRHIKATGIFARLACRDGKRQFLDEIPLTRKHLVEELDLPGLSGTELALLRCKPK